MEYQVSERTFFKRLDLSFILVILTLNIVGLINLYSATHGPQAKEFGSLFISQLVWLSAGWSIFFITTLLDYTFIRRVANVIFGLNLLAIIFVTFFGKVALGAQRWIDLGFFRYQPSETMKIALLILLAKILSQRNTISQGMGFKDLFVPLILIFIPVGFIIEQPDLGTALMLLAIGGSMILFARVKKSIIILGLVSGLIAAPLLWNFVLHDYQKNRIYTFLSPTNDPRGSGYNSIQSKIAVGSGQFLGKGFRKGTQSQLEFLPERHTDFIFSVLSEEFGFMGSALTIGLFCILFVLGTRIASQAKDKFGALLVMGVLFYIFWHMFVNIGMVIGLLPIVGVPLPLLSYGGSSLITTMMGLGIISSVAYRRYLF